jgi:hypothetical protein
VNRPIFQIAKDIKNEWGSKVYFGAVPYLEAMQFLSKGNDKYGFDDGYSILRYFLSNASSFRGENAKQLKEEIKNILKEA